MRTARLACVLLLVAGPAWAQPVFSRQGDGQIRNLTLSGGVFGNPMASSAQALAPTIKCAGNAGADAAPTSTGLAYGTVCVHVIPPTDAVGPLQTYAAQFGVTVPNQASQKNLPARDAVGLYAEGRFGAFGPAGWAENPLAQSNKDSSGVITSEMDLNNLSGCDSPGITSNTTGGSAAFVANRSDGSACPKKTNLLITGVATNTSTAGIEFSYVSDGQHAMWQDGIRMLGGYMVAENEWISDTLAPTAFKIKGVHGYDGLGLETGRFGDAAVSLSSQDIHNGRIRWHGPDNAAAIAGYPAEADLYAGADGAMHLDGAPLTLAQTATAPTFASNNYVLRAGGNLILDNPSQQPVATIGYDQGANQIDLGGPGTRITGSAEIDGNLAGMGTARLATAVAPGTNGLIIGTPAVSGVTIMSGVYAPSGWANNVAEWYLGTAAMMSLSNTGRLTLPSGTGGLAVQGAASFGGSVTAGTAVLADTIGPNTSGRVAFSGPIQLPVMTVAQLPSGCTAGEMGYASDGRKTGENAGAGSGVAVLCTRSGSATVWAPVTTATTAVAN